MQHILRDLRAIETRKNLNPAYIKKLEAEVDRLWSLLRCDDCAFRNPDGYCRRRMISDRGMDHKACNLFEPEKEV